MYQLASSLQDLTMVPWQLWLDLNQQQMSLMSRGEVACATVFIHWEANSRESQIYLEERASIEQFGTVR